MAKDCWCNLRYHLPGEKKRHKRVREQVREMLGLVERIDGHGARK